MTRSRAIVRRVALFGAALFMLSVGMWILASGRARETMDPDAGGRTLGLATASPDGLAPGPGDDAGGYGLASAARPRTSPSSMGTPTYKVVTIEGSAVGPEGEAVAGVRIFAVRGEGEEPEVRGRGRDVGAAVTDSRGRFRVDGLAPGRYRLGVDGWVSGVVVDEPGRSRSRRYRQLDLCHASAPSAGTALRLAAGVEVEVVDETGSGVDEVDLAFDMNGAETSPAGGFEARTRMGFACFDLVPSEIPGRLRLTPPEDRPDLAARVLDAWTPKPERIRLGALPTISGIVADAAGRPVPGAWIVADGGPSEAPKPRRSGPDGRFRIGMSGKRSLTLSAYRGSEVTEELEPELLGAPVTVEGGTTEVRLMAAPVVGQTVRVPRQAETDPTTQVAYVARVSPGSRAGTRLYWGNETIELENLAPGIAYSLFVPGLDDRPPLWIERFVGGQAPIDMTAAHTTPVDGRVQGPDGSPVEGLELRLTGPGWWAEGSTRADGSFRIQHAISFPVELEVRPTRRHRFVASEGLWERTEVSREGFFVDVHLGRERVGR